MLSRVDSLKAPCTNLLLISYFYFSSALNLADKLGSREETPPRDNSSRPISVDIRLGKCHPRHGAVSSAPMATLLPGVLAASSVTTAPMSTRLSFPDDGLNSPEGG